MHRLCCLRGNKDEATGEQSSTSLDKVASPSSSSSSNRASVWSDLFGLKDYGTGERVPWDLKTTLQVLTLWLVGFCLVGGVGIPIITQWFGFHKQSFVCQTLGRKNE